MHWHKGFGKKLLSRIFIDSDKDTNELPRDKTNSVVVRPAKTQISLDIPPVLSESWLSA